MVKNILTAAIVGLIICAGVKAEARDVYVGTSSATGWDCYIMTDTIKRYNGDMDYGGDTAYTQKATLKMVTGSGNVQYLDYTFHVGNFPMWFENSQGYRGRVTRNDTPIEWNMHQVMKNY